MSEAQWLALGSYANLAAGVYYLWLSVRPPRKVWRKGDHFWLCEGYERYRLFRISRFDDAGQPICEEVVRP